MHVRGRSQRAIDGRRRDIAAWGNAPRRGVRLVDAKRCSLRPSSRLRDHRMAAVQMLPAPDALLVQRQADRRGWSGTPTGPCRGTPGGLGRRPDLDRPSPAGAPLRATLRRHADRCPRCRSRFGANGSRRSGDRLRLLLLGHPRIRRLCGRGCRFDRRARGAGRPHARRPPRPGDERPRVPVLPGRDCADPGRSRRRARRGLREVPRRVRTVHGRGVGAARLLAATGGAGAADRVRTGRHT